MTGRTRRVRSVEETSPPMITVASGRCTSAPAPCASSIGMNPNPASAAVVLTGRMEQRLAAGHPLGLVFPDRRDHHDAVEHGDPEERYKPDAGRDGEGKP